VRSQWWFTFDIHFDSRLTREGIFELEICSNNLLIFDEQTIRTANIGVIEWDFSDCAVCVCTWSRCRLVCAQIRFIFDIGYCSVIDWYIKYNIIWKLNSAPSRITEMSRSFSSLSCPELWELLMKFKTGRSCFMVTLIYSLHRIKQQLRASADSRNTASGSTQYTFRALLTVSQGIWVAPLKVNAVILSSMEF
jgi:hypothetical protein